MSELPPWAILAAILLAAIIVFALAWRLTRGTHVVVRAVTRVLLGALIFVPALMFFVVSQGGMMDGADKVGSAPPAPAAANGGSGEHETASKDDAKPKRKKTTRRYYRRSAKPQPPTSREDIAAADDTASAATEESAESPPTETAAAAPEAITEEEIAAINSIEPGAGSPSPSEASPGAGIESAPAAGSPPAAANGSSGSAGSDAPRAPSRNEVAAVEAPPEPPAYLERLPAKPTPPPSSESEPAAAAAPKKDEDWSIVPVFFGTDRKRADKPSRIAYNWKRGRRLELGRALVTIPKKHEVPMVERPWALKIPYIDVTLYEAAEDPKLHFTIKELKALSKEDFLSLVRARLAKSSRFKDHALVFVHGYKNKFDNAVYRTAQIAYDLKFDGAPFLYSWPSGGTLQGYTYDRESASSAEPYLREFLEIVSKETGAKKLSVIAHSMGNQLLLRVLQDFKRSLPEGVLISQLILAAPDVDRDSFEHIVSSIGGIAEGITLYAAANDTALQVSRQVNGGEPRAGDVPEGGPIVLKGIDTIDATATSMDSVGINHNGYAENNALLEDIGRLISSGLRPPEARLPKLKRIETEKGPYWQYPNADQN